jgi:hypothetical protein
MADSDKTLPPMSLNFDAVYQANFKRMFFNRYELENNPVLRVKIFTLPAPDDKSALP